MFDGVPEQLHQFIASSRTTTTLPLPSLSFSSPSSLHHHHHHHGSSSNPTNNNNNTIFPNFDPLFITGTNISSPQVQVQLLPLHQVQVQQQPNSFLLHPFTHNQQSQPQKSSEDHLKQQESDRLVVVSNMSNNLESNSSSSSAAAANWSNDEVLALLRIRSSLDNWFPESTWAHVSRKLEEVGYKRSAEKCKEKFEEEESRYLGNINYNKISSHCRFFNEFEDFYSNINHGQNPHDDDDHHHHHENIKKLEIKPTEEQEQEQEQEQQDKNLLLVDGLKLDSNKKDQKGTEIKKKRKRVQQKKKKEEEEEEFEMLKGFCEDIVKKMMVQQEEMHEKLVEDMVKRDEEKFAREEAWKKVEMDKINKQLEIRTHEQAIVSDRQATLIKFLKSFTTTTTTSSSTYSSSGTSNSTTSNNSDHHHHHHQNRSSEESPVDKVPIIAQNNPNDHQVQNPSSNLDEHHHHPNPKLPTSQNPNSDPTQMIKKSPLSPPTTTNTTTSTSAVVVSTQTTALILSNDDHHDTGKRWPRDEVFALINMRCSLHNNNGDQQDKEGQANKIPLWERISQGMSQLGYKRSSKRCKEKWENINKYFRKTKDNVNKKRSLDSRTCPYFHQLSTLYNQGTLVVPPSSNEGDTGNIPAALPENLPVGSNSQAGSSSTDSTAIHVSGHHDQAQGEKVLAQVPTFDFEF